MHKEYIKIPRNVCIDYIPEDRKLCGNCVFFTNCPYEYTCDTLTRLQAYENVDNDNTDIGDEKA